MNSIRHFRPIWAGRFAAHFLACLLVLISAPLLQAQSLPSVTTLSAMDIKPGSATLRGSFDTQGASGVSAWFDWGLSTNYGNVTPATFSGALLENLIAGATYHFRAGASNQAGTAYGTDLSVAIPVHVEIDPLDNTSFPPVGRGAGWLAAGDFNGDGLTDLACANRVDNNVSILLRLPRGGFTNAPGVPISTGRDPRTVVTADFNGDGHLDLMTADTLGNSVTLLLGDGAGSFQPAPGSPIATGIGPWGIAVADFNGDGLGDVAVANSGSTNLTILLGDGHGGFTPGATLASPGASIGIAAADLDGDGITDLVCGRADAPSLSLLLGDGHGGFHSGPQPSLSVQSSTFAVVVADLNEDGVPDIASTDTYNHTVSIWLGTRSGKFIPSPFSPIATSPYPRWIGVVDLEGDGIPELVTANEGGGEDEEGTINLIESDGTGSYVATALTAGRHSNALALIDVDGDKSPDLVCVNGGHLQENSGSLTAFQIRRISPSFGVNTLSASRITPTGARLEGEVIAVRHPVTAWFEWGTNTSYGNKTGTQRLPEGYGSLPVGVDLNNLETLGQYHFRMVVADGTNLLYGGDARFIPDYPFTYKTNGGAITITGYTSDNPTVTIPPTINGWPVSEISDWAFTGKYLTQVVLPDSIIAIRAHAFQNIGGLTNLVVPDGVRFIGIEAFASCRELNHLSLGKRVAVIRDMAFSDCSALSEVMIPDGVMALGDDAFANCVALSRVVIGKGVVIIGNGAFVGCSHLASIMVGEGVISIGDGAFDTSYVTFPNIPRRNQLNVYFGGGVPVASNPFGRRDPNDELDFPRVHRLLTASGWGTTFGDALVEPWLPEIRSADGRYGLTAGSFGFNVSWVPGGTVVVEASTSLTSPVWTAVGTNTLAAGSARFADLEGTNHSVRFYRLRLP